MAIQHFTIGNQTIYYDTVTERQVAGPGGHIVGGQSTPNVGGTTPAPSTPSTGGDQSGQAYQAVIGPDGRITYVPIPGQTRRDRNDSSTAPTAPATQANDTFDAQSAANITGLLHTLGLDELVPFVDGWVRQDLSWPEIQVMLDDPSTPAGAVVDRMYPERRLRREAGRAPVSIQQIVDYRESARNLARTYGLPSDYINAQRVSSWIVNDVSLDEQKARIETGIVRVRNDSPEVAQELQRLYGLSEGALALMVLDPSAAPLDAIQRHVASAEVSGAGVRVGFGGLTTQEAEHAVSLGINADQAGQSLGNLAGAKELFTPLNAGEDPIDRSTQLGAVFDNNTAAQKRIEQRARSRAATFQGGGGIATTRDGLGGLSTQN